MRAAIAIAIIGLVGAAGCGGSTARSGSRVITINALDDGTRAAHTARLKGVMTETDGGNTVVQRATGELDFDQDAMHIRAVSADGKSLFEMIGIGKRTYARGDFLGQGIDQQQWCPQETTEDIDPGAVLESLTRSHATLQRVGDETINGVATTHYHVVTQDQTLELWVDANDRLRRLIGTSEGTTQTIDLYDFGADIEPIHAPSTQGCPPQTSETCSGDSMSSTTTCEIG